MKVYILPNVHAEIMHYVHKSHLEISGLGRIEKDSAGNMVVTKVYLLKQENTGASTDICESAASDLLYESREDKGDLNFWWHSHVNMGVFWSGTDMATIRQFGGKGYLLSTVFNKKGEHRSSYFQGNNGFLPELFIDELKTEFTHIPSKSECDRWDAEYAVKCAPKKYEPIVGGHYHSGGRRWNNQTGKFEELAGTKQAEGTGHHNEVWRKNMSGTRGWDGWGEDDDYGYGMQGYKGDDYTTKPINADAEDAIAEEVEFIGTNTGKTVDDIIKDFKRLFYASPTPSYDDLSVEDALMVLDAFELINKVEVQWETGEMERFYQTAVSNQTEMIDLEYALREVQYGTETKEEPA